ncbi:TonB-dependent receptor [Helicobacter sp. MIT 14-3879]|uniref:TonB-dependent receptor n=1 Tax=Helicobacter sp. MIT 14-3879 TaxID=2040649 RepID=UPI00216232B8|nr:TonB-dependent receptor [Helicobacter sp. MIT 14-3879]
MLADAETSSTSIGHSNNNNDSIQSQQVQKVIVTATMKSTLDELNRNLYEIDKEQIQNRGYRSTEDIFAYMPFVGLSNVGLGSNLDLRGQGNRANTSVQVLINGIYANMLDSSHGVTPMNTLSPNTIESIEILPGGGAVMYGNGTRGGVVNITTQKRYDKPFFTAGFSYAPIIASRGNSINADAKFGTKIGDKIHISLGAAYLHRGGPRRGDLTQGGQANLGLTYDIISGHSLYFNADYFYGDIQTSPNNSFMDIPNPTKADRKTAGNGNLHNTQQRLDISLGYEGHFTSNSTLDLKAFYHLNRIDYVDSVTRLSNYNFNNLTWQGTAANQSGSLFDDHKAGLMAKWDWQHDRGRFIAGLESLYNRGKRVMNQLINGQTNTNNMFSSTGNQNTAYSGTTIYNHSINIPFTGEKWSNSLFVIEKYDFTKRFSLTGGLRYEAATYWAEALYKTKGGLYQPNGDTLYSCATIQGATRCFNMESIISTNNGANGKLNETQHNFAVELTPHFHYSDNGSLYAKYERGYFSPSPNNLLQRQSRTYLPTDLKKETYDTFEIGLKDYWADTISFSAALFYTLTHNEFYTIGNAHSVSGVQYGNYDRTQRVGIELFSEQFFFADTLRLSESFTYVDARVLRNNGAVSTLKIPYVSNYKATLGIHYQPISSLGVWLQNSFIGAQKDIETFTTTGMGANATRISNGQKDIPGYILTDLGVNYQWRELSISAGVRNLFDVFYYSYYNGDSSDTIAGYGFLIGEGRSIFLEGRYTF